MSENCCSTDIARHVNLYTLTKHNATIRNITSDILSSGSWINLDRFQGYLHHYYYALPRHMVFVHADMPDHIGAGRPNIIDDTLRALMHGASVPFAHLGNNRVTMRWNPDTMTPLWKGLFGSSIAPQAGEVSTYCCSHFVLSRDRALIRTRRFYENALKFVMSPKSYFYLPTKWTPSRQAKAADIDMRGRLVCQNMMFLWHIFFGEPLDLPHRMYDPSLPLFLKTRNIRTAYFDDDGLWIQKGSGIYGFDDMVSHMGADLRDKCKVNNWKLSYQLGPKILDPNPMPENQRNQRTAMEWASPLTLNSHQAWLCCQLLWSMATYPLRNPLLPP